MRKNKRTIISIISCFILIFAIGITMYYSIMSPINRNNTSYLYIDEDDDIDSVCSKAEDIIPGIADMMFNLMTNISSYRNHIHTGRYEISPTTSTLELFLAIRGHRTVPVRLVVPSVRTISEMAERISNQMMVDAETLESILTDEQECHKLGFTIETIPAFFIPDTYEIYWDASTEKILQKLKDGYDQFWDDTRLSKSEEIGLSPIEVSIMASIVDSETSVDDEKPRVAGLYMNRLHKGMKLQSDPTVIYATGDFSIRRVLKNHLKIDSPYNTYMYEGLPPGPIRIPTIAGIDAVLNHERNNYIFMCAKEDLSGTHNFASNSAEHQANARKYQRALNQIGIRQ